ncbi:hypothetical protein Bbelb_211430 [Branchiostoma belcheri]|nr:hypothetical protein Bbelb_211430 [Branchiostoma belcheri]
MSNGETDGSIRAASVALSPYLARAAWYRGTISFLTAVYSRSARSSNPNEIHFGTACITVVIGGMVTDGLVQVIDQGSPVLPTPCPSTEPLPTCAIQSVLIAREIRVNTWNK